MKPPSAPARSPLPKWAEAIRRKYVGGEASMFVLHGNVFDHVLHDGKLWSLEDFLIRVLLWDNKQSILLYDPAAGLRAAKGDGELQERLQALGDGDALAVVESQLTARSGLAVILSYGGSIVPPGDEHFLSQQDRLNAVRLHRWSLSKAVAEKDNVVFLLAESLVELNGRLVANPRVAAVEVPLPDGDVRAAVIGHVDATIPADQVARLAAHTAGLRSVHIAQLLAPAAQAAPDDAERVRYITSLLGDSTAARERAQKLAALTRGMDYEEIRHLIDPDQPLPETVQHDAYAEVLELAYKRKREIIEKECAGLIEFVSSSHDLSAVGGNEAIKQELQQIAEAVRSGERTRVPMGLLFVGAMGCGKTFVAKAFVKSSGLSAVMLKNFRSKWVGSTEANLEKVLALVKALGPIILIIDEGDRSFGGQSEDSDGGTSSRIIARLKEFMSDTDNRGRVLFILMTNRPDKLDVDIKRAGRLDRKIPFFYCETAPEVEQVLGALLTRHGGGGALDWEKDRARTSERLVGYSNADLEAVTLLALEEARVANAGRIDAGVMERVIGDYMPSRDTTMIEYMELLAVFEASRRSMLPQRYRELTLPQLQERLGDLRRRLRIA